MTTIAVRHDLRRSFGPARDQGQRATCLAFAMSDAHSAARVGPWEALSCEYLFYQAKKRDHSPPDDGTTISAIEAALYEDGQPIEASWPYQKKLPANLLDWRPPRTIGILHRRRSSRWTHKFQEVWAALEADRSIVIGMTLPRSFFMPNADGIIDSAEVESPVLRHAIVAVGTGMLDKQRLVLVRNSWGATWGLSGYAWLSEQYMARRIIVALTVDRT